MTKEELEQALEWALRHGAVFHDYGSPGFDDRGCGCCSGYITPPEGLVGKLIDFALERKLG